LLSLQAVFEDADDAWLTYEEFQDFVTDYDFNLMLFQSMTDSIIDAANAIEAEKIAAAAAIEAQRILELERLETNVSSSSSSGRRYLVLKMPVRAAVVSSSSSSSSASSAAANVINLVD